MATRSVALVLASAILIAVSLLPALPSSSAAVTAATSPAYPLSPPNAGSSGRSSVILPVKGNVYPDGEYHVEMMVGEPAKPYFFDIDTGSDLTWLNCDFPCINCPPCPHPWYKPVKGRKVRCEDPLCIGAPGIRDCHAHPLQCDYQIHYQDNGSSVGELTTDAFTLPLVKNSVTRRDITFGCGYNQRGNRFNSAVMDGVLGLGCGTAPSTFLNQMRTYDVTNKVVSHCLGRRGGGFLLLGDASIPKNGITWLPLACSSNDSNNNPKYYSPGSADVYVDKQKVGEINVAFDSGSTYTYFSNQPYQGLLSAVKNEISRSKKLTETTRDEDNTLSICWKGPKPFRSVLDARDYFKKVILSFAGNKAFLVIPPENYLIVTNLGNVCLGILNGAEEGLNNLSLIGDISMQDLMVVYDTENTRIGWVPANCERTTKPGNGNSHM